ncbi:hypothetical protein ACN4EG_22300 [Alkalinema pantanalense CENA528]
MPDVSSIKFTAGFALSGIGRVELVADVIYQSRCCRYLGRS